MARILGAVIFAAFLALWAYSTKANEDAIYIGEATAQTMVVCDEREQMHAVLKARSEGGHSAAFEMAQTFNTDEMACGLLSGVFENIAVHGEYTAPVEKGSPYTKTWLLEVRMLYAKTDRGIFQLLEPQTFYTWSVIPVRKRRAVQKTGIMI